MAAAPLAGVAWRVARKVRLSLEAGPVFYLPVEAGDGAVSYLGEAKALWQGRRLRAALIFLRDLYGGSGAPQAIWSEQATGVLAWRVLRNADVRLSGGLGRQGAAPNADTDASTLGGRAEVRVALWHRLRFDVFAEHRTQDADGGLAFGDVDRTLVGARLVGVIGTSLETLSEVP
jgi:hypothetical protein